MPSLYPSFSSAISELGRKLRYFGHEVSTARWQGVDAPAPMRELLEADFRAPIIGDLDQLKKDIQPSLPWADMHFEERVSGIPYNPPPSAQYWPYNPGSKEFRESGKYTHTYPERFWPKYAGEGSTSPLRGIRYLYGDLNDVIQLLRRDPLTRQAYLPVWFPEDTGAVHGGRVPCTLGYLFMNRRGYFHCTYYIRSCDYFRHFRDDIYLAARLTLWILDQLKNDEDLKVHESWKNVQPGFLNMYIGSLHCWLYETAKLPR